MKLTMSEWIDRTERQAGAQAAMLEDVPDEVMIEMYERYLASEEDRPDPVERKRIYDELSERWEKARAAGRLDVCLKLSERLQAIEAEERREKIAAMRRAPKGTSEQGPIRERAIEGATP